MIKKTVLAVGLCWGALLVASCELNLFDDECYSDADCPRGYVCDYRGVAGNSCVPGCYRHSDCPAGYYCTSCDSKGCHGEGMCERGCRTSAECSETRWCDNGTCVRGCFGGVCADGRPGSVCVGSSLQDPVTECRWSCSTDVDCADALAKQCTAGVCIQSCSDDRDCRAGFTCRPVSGCTQKACFLK